MESKITNIELSGDNIIAFGIFNGNEERQIFGHESTVQDILDWALSRKEYYSTLISKVADIKKILLNKEL